MTAPVELRTEPPLAIVRMCDTDGRNRFTPALCTRVIELMAEVGADPDIRAVVLEGLPDVFCAGGSAERMLGSHQERVVEIWELFRSVAECPIPVVAAVQGHAIGGGLLLALYCDVAVFSARARYGVNFLTYGFTPTLGASYLLPVWMGAALGREMLYTGRSYPGRELANRGAGIRVTGHDHVTEEARRTAFEIARAPRRSLELAKSQLLRPIREGVESAMGREIPDHEVTIGSAEVRRRIRALYGGSVSPSQAGP